MTALFWFLKFLVGLTALGSIAEGKRISQIKCEEYINGTITRVSMIPLLPNPKPRQFLSFNCSKTVDLILGGENARSGEFRHQALLGWETEQPDEYSFDCGGTLISDRFVLTAGHCTSKGTGPRAAPKIVRFAELDLTVVSGNEVNEDIDEIFPHPRYRFSSAYNDIALIRLKKRVKFSGLVRPACLGDDATSDISSVIATGFGWEEGGEKSSDTLRKVQLQLMDPKVCNASYAGHRKLKRGITDQQLCIGSNRGARDTCQGDSGGPVQLLLNPKGCIYHVVGITSVGSACIAGATSTAAVYIKVASYIDWIERVVWG